MNTKKHVTVTIALAGQPNVGKSAVFNMLTGMNQRVGNWPGKTVEQKKGTFTYNGNTYEVVDLPGTYSMTANSPEERIARDFIIREQPDIVVVVVNAAALERTLYLVAELLPMRAPLIIALNMMDVAGQEGYQINPEVLESAMGVKVVPMIASKNKGIAELEEAIDELARNDGYSPSLPEMQGDHQTVLTEIQTRITGHMPAPYPEDWAALKLLEGDRVVTEMMKESLGGTRWESLQNILRHNGDAMLAVGSSRYDWIERGVKNAIQHPEKKVEQISRTEKIDRYAVHPVWGMLIMSGIFIVTLALLMATAKPVMKGAMKGFHALQPVVLELFADAPAWVSSLIANGVIFGVVVLLIFLWFLALGFLAFGIVEDVGYMARIAYLMDRAMSKIGLHGKSSLCLFTGFMCNVEGVVGTRTLETERARLKTILLTPFIPCPAQMVVTIFLAAIFFTPKTAIVVLVALIWLNLTILALFGRLFDRVVFRGERLGLIMELPLYHRPNLRTIGMSVWRGCEHFLKKVGTVIFAAFIFIWAISYFPNGDIDTSFLATSGKVLAPLGHLMGLNWQMLVALLTSFISKETTITTMGVLLGTGSEAGLVAALRTVMPPAVALGFMVTSMLFVPCTATVGVIASESRSWRWALFTVAYLFVVAFGMGIMVYQVARLFL